MAQLSPAQEPIAIKDAQAKAPGLVISLDQALELALNQGPDNQVLSLGLLSDSYADAVNQAKNGFTLSINGGAGLGFGFDEPANAGLSKSLIASSQSTSVAPGVAAGLSMGIGQTKIGISASQTLSPGLTVSGPTSIGLTLTQNLWDGYPGGQLKATADLSSLSLKGKQLSTETSRLTILANVKKSYYALLGYQRALVLKQAIYEKQANLLRQIQAVYDLRQASLLDLKDATLNARGAELDIKSALHDLNLARQRFAIQLGLPPDSDYKVAELNDIAPSDLSLETAISRGLTKRSDLAQYDLNIKSTQISLAQAKGASDISLSLVGAVNAAVDWSSSVTRSGQSVFAGLKIGFPIIDSGAAQSQVDNLNSLISSYQLSAQTAKLTISTDIRDAFETLQILTEREEIARLTAERYDMKYEIVKSQLEHGTATNQDLLAASVDSATYETAYFTARTNRLLAALQLQTAIGE